MKITPIAKFAKYVCLIFSFFILYGSAWAQSEVAKSLSQELKKSKAPSSDLGLCVLDEMGHEVYSLNQDRMFIPASLTKLLTAAAALKTFSPGYKFETHLMSDASIENHTLKGNLYFKGGGDPAFISEKMWFLVNEFTRQRITEIQGAIIVDDTLFDSERFDPGRDPSRVDRAYDSPIGAASFNWNSVNVFVRPGNKVGEPLEVFADPMSEYIKVENRTRTVKSGAPSISVSRIDGKQGDVLQVQGSLALGSKEIVKYVSISKPDYWTGAHLVEFLKQRGITVSGGIKTGRTPSQAISLAKVESQPLYEIILDMLKFSNNYIAEMITKQLAVQMGSVPGTMPAGLKAVSQYLLTQGISAADFELTSPSGLSQRNRIRPQKLCQLLFSVKKDLKIFPELAAGLPLAGVDGTLKSRMKDTHGAVRGKTGLLNNAVGLAGYAGRTDGQTLTYVFLYNGGLGNQTIWPLFDTLARRLVE